MAHTPSATRRANHLIDNSSEQLFVAAETSLADAARHLDGPVTTTSLLDTRTELDWAGLSLHQDLNDDEILAQLERWREADSLLTDLDNRWRTTIRSSSGRNAILVELAHRAERWLPHQTNGAIDTHPDTLWLFAAPHWDPRAPHVLERAAFLLTEAFTVDGGHRQAGHGWGTTSWLVHTPNWVTQPGVLHNLGIGNVTLWPTLQLNSVPLEQWSWHVDADVATLAATLWNGLDETDWLGDLNRAISTAEAVVTATP